MSSTINTSSSMFLANYIRLSQAQIDQSLERLGSGLRVRSPKDDVGAYFMASNFERRFDATSAIAQNLEDNIAALKSALEPLNEIKSLLEEIANHALAASTENDANVRRNIANEAQLLGSDIDSLITTSTFDGVNYISTQQNISVQVDESSSSTINVLLYTTNRTAGSGLNLAGNYSDPVSYFGNFGATATEQANAINFHAAITSARPDNGTASGLTQIDRNILRIDNALLLLENRRDALNVKANNYEAARSTLVGVDDAVESTKVTAAQIRQQAAAFFLSQANSANSNLISFFFK